MYTVLVLKKFYYVYTFLYTSAANVDYVPIRKMVSFESEWHQCASIEIINDEDTEGEERFVVVLMKDGVRLSRTFVVINSNSECITH